MSWSALHQAFVDESEKSAEIRRFDDSMLSIAVRIPDHLAVMLSSKSEKCYARLLFIHRKFYSCISSSAREDRRNAPTRCWNLHHAH